MVSQNKGASRPAVTRDEVARFDKVVSQMRQLADDMGALAKKTPDGPVSKFKIGVINEQLRNANGFVQPPFKPIEGFEEFDQVSLPTSSDVVMVLSQYLTCLERWRCGHIHYDKIGHNWIWNIRDATVRTDPSTASRDSDGEW